MYMYIVGAYSIICFLFGSFKATIWKKYLAKVSFFFFFFFLRIIWQWFIYIYIREFISNWLYFKIQYRKLRESKAIAAAAASIKAQNPNVINQKKVELDNDRSMISAMNQMMASAYIASMQDTDTWKYLFIYIYIFWNFLIIYLIIIL